MATAISPAKSAGVALPVPDYNSLPSNMNGMDGALWTLEQEPRTVPKERLRVRAVQISGWVEPVVLMLLDKRVPQPRQAKSGWGEGQPEGMVHLGALPRKALREPQGALQIPPLRYATVGMTRGEG
jgi:hypothetical protein